MNKFDENLLKEYFEYVEELKKTGEKGLGMRLLQKMQEVFGYVPEEILLETSRRTNIPSTELYGVATFYHQFSFVPKGKHVIQICLGTACYVKGAGQILEKVESALEIEDGMTSEDGLFSIDTTRCVGDCGNAPIMIVDGKVYHKVTLEEVDKILSKLVKEEEV